MQKTRKEEYIYIKCDGGHLKQGEDEDNENDVPVFHRK